MKANAIVRIILFSLAIFILLGILGLGLGVRMFAAGDKFSETLHTVQGEWSDSYTFNPDKIRDLEIDWVSGTITILPSDAVTDIVVAESEISDDTYRMICKTSGSKLSIQFCKDSIKFPSIGISTNISKDLIITVPLDWYCSSVQIDAAAADVEIRDFSAKELDFDGASGTCDLINCNIGDLDLDAASGDITFSGCLETLDFDGASAACTLVLDNCPKRIELDGMSGDLDLTLPEDCGFTVNLSALSSDFTSEFETSSHDDRHVYGNGACKINIDALSGDIIIRKK